MSTNKRARDRSRSLDASSAQEYLTQSNAQLSTAIRLALDDAKRVARPLPSTVLVDVDDTEGHEALVLKLHAELHERYAALESVCDRLCRIEQVILQQPLGQFVRAVGEIKDALVQALRRYTWWRLEDGCYAKSPSMVRCCGSSAHGWDSMSRVYTLEAMIFSIIGRARRARQWKTVQFTQEDMRVLAHPRTNVLVCDHIPVRIWSSKMVTLQLRSLAQRFNQLRDLPKRKRLRNALMKLNRQCELRGYSIVYACTHHKRLQEMPVHSDDGLLSGSFTGQIICTPQNNCGMSNVGSAGTWTERFTWSTARCASKSANVLFWAHRFCRGRHVSMSHVLGKNKESDDDDRRRRVRNFRESARANVRALLDADQLQGQVIASVYPSVVGFDAPVRKDNASQDTSREADIWTAAQAVAPSAQRKWFASYLRVTKSETFWDSALSRAVPDLRALCVCHAFEISTRRDGRNAAGFLRSFFVRADEAQSCFATIREVERLGVPIVAKVGGSYAAVALGQGFYVACDDMCEAIIAWSELMRAKRWRVDRLDFSQTYEPVLKQWCSSKRDDDDDDTRGNT